MTYNPVQIDKNVSAINKAVASRHLREAFISLRHHASQLGDWHVTDNIDRLEEDYKLMLSYMTKGVSDPHSQSIYNSIVSRILSLTDHITYKLKKSQAPEIYFSTFRFESLQKDDSLQSLTSRYREVSSKLSLSTMMSYSGNSKQSLEILQRETLELERRIFNRIWVMYPFGSESVTLINSLLDSSKESFPPHFPLIIISALLLGLIQYHDESKLMILLDIYGREQQSKIGITALCAALLDMYLHRDYIDTDRVANRVESLRETTTWHSDVQTIFMQFLRSRDTERLNRELNEKVLPELMKLKPEITKRLNASEIEIGNLEDNPEWEEMLKSSGMYDKLKQMQEMLEDGGDIFMSAFASLKSTPFFNEPVNWFMPYRADHLALSHYDSSLASICRLLEGAEMLCDSDKYSIAFALGNIPPQQRQLLKSQLDASMMAAMEIQTAEMVGSPKSVAHYANNYVSSVYRFFKLFCRKSDFTDPFATPLDLLSVKTLEADFDNIDMLRTVAEFYFKRGYHENAFNVYSALEQRLGFDCPTYQKMGYCRQKLGDYDGALNWYGKAEILDNKNLWTLRRMAACYSALNQTTKALECLDRISVQRPDDLNVAMNIGHCYLELDKPEKALKQYFKVEYLDEKSERALRPIAWCSLLTGNFNQSLKYYNRILASNPNATDFLNIGHLYLSMGKMPEAMTYYQRSISENNNDITRFIHDFENDVPTLTKIGVNTHLCLMVTDSLLYGIK